MATANVGVILALMLMMFQPIASSSTSAPSSAAPSQQDKMLGKISLYEQSLLSTLLANYSTLTRPATSTHKAVSVEFELILSKIVRLNIRDQVLVLNAVVMMRWFDPQLAWNMSEWNNTNYLNVPASSLWVPDIMLYNTALEESKSPSDMYKAKVQIDSKGQLSWAAPVTLKASCSINIKWFPFDSQLCTLTFGSQSYTRSRLDLKFRRQPKNAQAIKGATHFDNGDWTLENVSSKRTEGKFDWSPEPYALIEYTFDLTRLYKYYLIYLVLPCVGLIFLGPFMFYLPADSGERTGFGVTVVLALSVYLLVISDKLPEKSDKTPLIGALYIVVFFLLVIAMGFGIITTHLCYKTTKPPRWLWRLVFGRKKEIKAIDTIRETQIKEDDVSMTVIENGVPCRSRLSKRSSILSGRFTPTIEEAGTNQHKWKLLVERLDKGMFIAYLALVIFVPVIVCLAFMKY